jgi:hypothetical protein
MGHFWVFLFRIFNKIQKVLLFRVRVLKRDNFKKMRKIPFAVLTDLLTMSCFECGWARVVISTLWGVVTRTGTPVECVLSIIIMSLKI